jgi:hypothetical protein
VGRRKRSALLLKLNVNTEFLKMIDTSKEIKWIQAWLNDPAEEIGNDIKKRMFKASEVAEIMAIYEHEALQKYGVLHSVSNCRNCQERTETEIKIVKQCKKCKSTR